MFLWFICVWSNIKNYLYKYNNDITGINFNGISDQIISITDTIPNTNIPTYASTKFNFLYPFKIHNDNNDNINVIEIYLLLNELDVVPLSLLDTINNLNE